MTQDACDAAFPPSNVDARMTQLGVGPIGRYLTVPGDTRGVTLGEIEAHLRAGHPVIVFDEVGNGARWRGGYAAGLADGQAARLHAATVNWHDVIFDAYDTDVPDNQLFTAGEYQRGHNDGLGHGWMPFGAYAGNNVLDYLYAMGYITYGVSANASSWHHGHARPAWCQWQQGFMEHPPIPSTDPGVVYSDDYGQYPSTTAHVAPDPEELTMGDITTLQALFTGLTSEVKGMRSELADFRAYFDADRTDGRDHSPVHYQGKDYLVVTGYAYQRNVTNPSLSGKTDGEVFPLALTAVPDGPWFEALVDWGVLGQPRPAEPTGEQLERLLALPVIPWPAG